MTTYYVVSSEYVGPNKSEKCNTHTVRITTEPPCTNLGHKIVADGWLGTSNDWDANAHGGFETQAEAEQEIFSLFGDDVRSTNDDDPTTVEAWIVGKYHEFNAEESENWCYESIYEITASTTDEEIDTLVNELENLANDDEITLDTHAVQRMLTDRRDELFAEN